MAVSVDVVVLSATKTWSLLQSAVPGRRKCCEKKEIHLKIAASVSMNRHNGNSAEIQ